MDKDRWSRSAEGRSLVLKVLAGEVSPEEAAAQVGAASAFEVSSVVEAYLHQKLPPKEAEVRAPVSGRTLIRWDTWGIAHLKAKNLPDLYFALGYAMAQERLWQLDYMRRRARGELSAILGPRLLPEDRLMRTIGIGRAGDQAASSLSEEVALVLNALAAGINAWAERAIATQRLPFEFDLLGYEPQPWRPADSIAVWKYRWWTLTGRLESIVAFEAARRLLPPDLYRALASVELGDETIVPGSAPASAPGTSYAEGSNNWTVAGERTATGFPVLCSDPHNPFANPSQWFEAQLSCPGMEAAGVIYCGTPGVYIGRNRQVAWGLTNHAAPVRDIYIETLNPADPTQYRDGDTWRPFEVERQTIEVRGGPAQPLEIWRSVRGPILNDVLPAIGALFAESATGDGPEPPLSLAWLGAGPETGFEAMLALHRAESAAEVVSALAQWPCPPLNFVYADRAGQIGYHVAGRVPYRQASGNGFRRADDPADAWQAMIPFASLPQVANPGQGWVATANNVPWTRDQHYVSMGDWSPGYRHRRIRERLEKGERLTPEAIGAVQADIVDARGADLTPRLLSLLNDSGDELVQRAAAFLVGWDGTCTTESVAATIWAAFWLRWTERIARARFPEKLVPLMVSKVGAVARACLAGEEIGWLAPGSASPEARAAFAEAVDWLQELLGPEPAEWQWGRVHRVSFPHPLGLTTALARRLSPGPFPTPGSQDTVRATGFEGRGESPFAVTSGSTYRFLADLSAPDRAWSVITSGQSAHPASAHYADQTELWLSDRRRPLWMSEADLRDNLEGTTTLVPEH